MAEEKKKKNVRPRVWTTEARVSLLPAVEDMNRRGLVAELEKIVQWPVYIARLETVRRDYKAKDLLEKLKLGKGEEWLIEARDFVRDCRTLWQDLAGKYAPPPPREE